MKRTLILFGNDNFESIAYKAGNIELKPNKLMAKLTTKNNIINFSNSNMNIEKAKSLLNVAIDAGIKLDGCLIALSDLLNQASSLELFEKSLSEFISLVKKNGIKCYIFDKLSKNSKSAIDYESLINHLNKQYEFKNVALRTIELFEKNESQANGVKNLCI